MDVLADFLKTAGVMARVEQTPCVDQDWTHRGIPLSAVNSTVDAARSTHVRMLCVAAGEYSMGEPRKSRPLTRGDVIFLLESASCRLRHLQPSSTLIVGSIAFKAGVMALATLNLPPATIVRGQENPESQELAIRLAVEALSTLGGWEQVSECLATSLFITSLRASEPSEAKDSCCQGWLRALVDPEIGAALRLMHQAPEYRWTVAELAEQLSISRSAFAERFKRITGRPPLEYLTWWRLQRAAARLRSGESQSIYELARSSGYRSEAAFSKAFRREFESTPGDIRRQARAQQHTPSQLQFEIKKLNAFELPEQETGLNLFKSVEVVRRPFDELLSIHRLNGVEYNVLRILRGNNSPMTVDEVYGHLLIPQSNLPEHMAGLASKNYATEHKETGKWEITKSGKGVLKKLDDPVMSIHRRQFAHFSAGEIIELNRLLVKLRSPAS